MRILLFWKEFPGEGLLYYFVQNALDSLIFGVIYLSIWFRYYNIFLSHKDLLLHNKTLFMQSHKQKSKISKKDSKISSFLRFHLLKVLYFERITIKEVILVLHFVGSQQIQNSLFFSQSHCEGGKIEEHVQKIWRIEKIREYFTYSVLNSILEWWSQEEFFRDWIIIKCGIDDWIRTTIEEWESLT